MVTEEADADDQIPLKKATHQQGAAWGVPSMGKQPHRKRQLPAFSVWQAGQLFGRDVMFGSFLLLTFFLYLRSTVPELCSIGPPPLGSGSSWNSSAPAPQPDEWPFTFRLVCGHVQGSLSTWNTQKIRSRFSSVVSSLDGSSSSSEAAQSAASASAGSQLGISVLLRSLLDSVIVFCAVLGLQVLRVLVYVGQGVFTFFACGFLTGDPFHVMIPPLRLGLVMLLLLPLPLPNLALRQQWAAAAGKHRQQGSSKYSSSKGSSEAGSANADETDDCSSCSSSKKHSSSTGIKSSSRRRVTWYRPSYWWQHPQFRAAVIILQRLLPPLTAALSVGGVGARFFELTALRYWPLLGQYMYLGWTAWMLVVPLKVHFIVNFTEWLLIYSTAVRVRMVHYDSPLICPTHIMHLLASLLFVLVLPTAGVAWVEHGQRERYQQTKAVLEPEHDGTAATQQQQQGGVAGKVQKSAEEAVVMEKPLKHSSLVRKRLQQQQQHAADGSLAAAGSAATTAAECSDHGSAEVDVTAVTAGTEISSLKAVAAGSRSRGHHARNCSVPAVSSTGPVVAFSSHSTSHSVGSSSGKSALGDQLLADINSSLQLAATWAAKKQATGSSSSGSGAGGSNKGRKLPFTLDNLMKESRRAAKAAAQPAAAAAAAPPVPQPVRYQQYTSMHRAATLPATAAVVDSQDSQDASSASTGFSAAADVQLATAAAPDRPTNSTGLFVVPDLAPAIKSLIGDQQAAAVFAAAATASGQVKGSPRPGMVPYYTSRAPRQSWNVGLQLA